jgi:8-oxo-dGTP pyrophosphatase MutT (NUDIX family)
MSWFDKSAIPDIVSQLITEDINHVLSEDEHEYHSAVAVIRYRDKWLLGLAKNTGDDRNHKWVMPGGGIKRGESPEAAAVREAKEETGVRCKAISGVMKFNGKKGVAFVACRSSSLDRPKPNHEFAHIGWFTVQEMKSLELYHNVRKLIDKAKKY